MQKGLMKGDGQLDMELMRHSAAHVMAAAVKRLFENVKLDIGPATEDGFYYDFDLPHRLSPEDFPRIEEEMQRIIDEDHSFERVEMSREEAESFLKKHDQEYKVRRLADISGDQEITFYKSGDFMDLCAGPHLESTGQIKAFKITSVAGSYFKGIETNPMLQRLYGIVAASSRELRQKLQQMEEAEKRDHRKLGRQLDLFSIQDEIGPGLVLWHPRGARIRSIIEDFWRQQHFRAGYEILYTPHIGRAALWEKSGHLEFYRENMYSPMIIDEEEYFAKPMNCPFHIAVYKNSKRSYRDLPLRWAELGTVYRFEKSGVLHGLLRVRGFTQDDAHIFCSPENIEEEVRYTLQFALKMLRSFGMSDFKAFLSTRPGKAVGEQDRWDQATSSLECALKSEGVPFEIDEGGGAFYGPKIDVKIKDALGREWQMSTIQFDFNIPERFDLTYVGSDGKEHRPYMVHRALLGALERFFGILIEHYGGAFPFWLAPEQVRVLPLTEKQLKYTQQINDRLAENGFRTRMDEKSDKIGAKIRNARLDKTPYMVILGPREEEKNEVSLRGRESGDEGALKIEELLERFKVENRPQE